MFVPNVFGFVDRDQHPFILPTLGLHFMQEKPKALVVREWAPKGSLRDLIYGEVCQYRARFGSPYSQQDPRDPYGRKYRSKGSPLSKQKLATIGRQILEALCFMKTKNWPMPHLHSGNIIMRDGTDAW